MNEFKNSKNTSLLKTLSDSKIEYGKKLELITSEYTENRYNSAIQILRDKPLSLIEIAKAAGEKISLGVLYVILVDFTTKLNISRNMDGHQLSFCCELIYQEYKFLSAAHLRVAFRNFLMGKYPEIQLYQSISSIEIMQIINRFCDDLQEAKRIQEQEDAEAARKIKQDFEQDMPPEKREQMKAYVQKTLNDLRHKLSSKEQAEQNYAEYKKHLFAFDTLHAKQQLFNNDSIKVVELQGVQYTFQQFIELKTNQS